MIDAVVGELAESRLGRTLKGKWTLDEILGIGGMATVYGATHRNGAKVAIKVLHSTLASSGELCRRFVREAYLVNRVVHPAVVRILDDDVDDDGAPFLVMDRVEGVSLCDRATERLFDEDEVLDVAEQVLDVLAASHAAGVVHRDLKPDNLLVDAEGTIRLLDFGVARLLEEDAEWRTRSGITFGTPGYMAPEQALGKTDEISPATDVYALGATLFTLLSGEFVQIAEGPQELLVMIATRPARSIVDVVPQTSPDVAALVDKATSFHPESRWASAEAMLAEVRRVKTKRGSELRTKAETATARSSEGEGAGECVGARESVGERAVGSASESVMRQAETKPAAEATRPSMHRIRRSTHTRRRWVVMAIAAVAAAFGLVKVQHRAVVTAQPVAEAFAEEKPAVEERKAAKDDPTLTLSCVAPAPPAKAPQPIFPVPPAPPDRNHSARRLLGAPPQGLEHVGLASH